MTKRKEVSEKTLELNVCAEMIQHIRSHPPFRKASWHGLTQREERQEGLDAKIRNAPKGVALMLQFKSPWATLRVDTLYKFTINRRQHKAMERLGHPGAVHYVFPLYSKWCKIYKNTPDLLQDTWLVPVECIPSKYLAKDSTTIEVRKLSPSGVRASGPNWESKCNAMNAGEYFQPRTGSLSDIQGIGVTAPQMREWIDGRDWTALRFRGLGFFYLPL
ncbi:MAG: hypothetical protein F4X57_13840 [Chloroflexi bacterium]|nr:hypothetical protein [Chloroflexota bacterium]